MILHPPHPLLHQLIERRALLVLRSQILLGERKIALRHVEVGMPHGALQGKDVAAVAQVEKRKGVAQVVRGDLVANLSAVFIQPMTEGISLHFFAVIRTENRRIVPARGADCQQFLNDIGYFR